MIRLFAPLAALSMLVLGCEKGPESTSPDGSSSATAQASQVATAAGSAEAAAEPASVEVGKPAPDVAMTLHDGSEVALASLKGSQVLIYFYPKDDTPGCRVEAQGIRDRYSEFEEAGVKVYGVSMQDAASHKAFIDKESLPFPLVVDDGTVAKAFGVEVKGEFAARDSILIGADGTIKQIWRGVSPSEHADDVLTAASS